MYKATRILISERQKYSPYVIEVVSVERIGGGRMNDCFNNACDALEEFAGAKIASGWIVKKYNQAQNSTEITQHFWNVSADGNHFDTTPAVSDDYEYVDDCEINEYGQANIDNLNDCVGSSLLLKDGKFFAVNNSSTGLVFNPIESLKTSNLFLYAAKQSN